MSQKHTVSQEQIVHVETFNNGLTLIAEPMPWLESAAFSISIPAGLIYDNPEKRGIANFACDMVQRGCGDRDSRAFVEDLEYLGVNDSSSLSVYHTHYGGSLPAGNINETLAIFADMLRHPHLPESQIEDARLACFQEVRAVEDDLAQKAMQQLRLNHYGDPYGRDSQGTMQSIAEINIDDVREFYQSFYRPNGMVLAVAGKINWDSLKDQVGTLFDDWRAVEHSMPKSTAIDCPYQHIDFDSQQTHIALAYKSLPYSHQDYFQARGAVGVLSDGMSSRLFTEVREKRGLCYTVYASGHSLKNRGSVLCYAGTGADRAQKTLDVIVEQLELLADGITEEELNVLKVQIRSGLVMQQESCRSRAASIAGDWFHLGRVRPLDEVNGIINSLTVESINQYISENPPSDFDIVTLGPNALEAPHGISTTSAR